MFFYWYFAYGQLLVVVVLDVYNNNTNILLLYLELLMINVYVTLLRKYYCEFFTCVITCSLVFLLYWNMYCMYHLLSLYSH